VIRLARDDAIQAVAWMCVCITGLIIMPAALIIAPISVWAMKHAHASSRDENPLNMYLMSFKSSVALWLAVCVVVVSFWSQQRHAQSQLGVGDEVLA
jgi:uncharacterized membrane protein